MTTMLYWTGLEEDEELSPWMPKDTSLIPLQALSPNTEGQLISLSLMRKTVTTLEQDFSVS